MGRPRAAPRLAATAGVDEQQAPATASLSSSSGAAALIALVAGAAAGSRSKARRSGRRPVALQAEGSSWASGRNLVGTNTREKSNDPPVDKQISVLGSTGSIGT